jgi:hypothetical protein
MVMSFLLYFIVTPEILSAEKLCRSFSTLCRSGPRLHNIAIYEASSINEISEHVKNIHAKIEKENTTYSLPSQRVVPLELRVMYRGQTSSEWPLAPGIMRPKNFDETSALRHLKMIHHSIFDKDTLSINDLSRAQHYGLHTRLLDFTSNLLSAIFFAVEKSKEGDTGTINALYVLDGATLNEFGCMNQKDKGILMPKSFETLLRLRAAESTSFKQLLSFPDIIESARFNCIDLNQDFGKIANKLRYPIAVHPNMDNPRIIAQDGRFVIWGGKKWPCFYEEEDQEDKKLPIKPVNIFNIRNAYEIDLVSDFPNKENFLKDKVYLKKNGNALKYKVLNISDEIVEDILNIQISEELTSENKVKILEEVSKKGDILYDIENKEFLHIIHIKNGYEIKKQLELYGINRPKMYQSIDDTTKYLNNFWSE